MADKYKLLTFFVKFVCFCICLSSILILFGCAAVNELRNTQKPRLDIKDVRVAGLDFEGLDLVFDVRIDNPNPISLSVAGYDFDFHLAGSSFLKGQQDAQVTVTARGESVVPIPVHLDFDNLYNTFSGLRDEDSTGYRMEVGFSFDIPVMGPTRLPLSVNGYVPMLKVPSIRVGGLKIDKLDLTGAELALELHVNNPNAFDLGLNKLDYSLAVSGKTWAQGNSAKPLTIMRKSNQTFKIPISLNFSQIGHGVFQILSGNRTLDYTLTGGLDLTTSLPLLPQASVPLDKAGKLDVYR